MAATPSIVFVPGGPGFSSRHEAAVLGPRFSRRSWAAHFSEEPWRRDSAIPVRWDAYVDAVAGTIQNLSNPTIIAHSFAVHPVVAAINKLHLTDCRLVLVAPSLELPAQHHAVVRLAAKGLAETAPELAKEMLDWASKSSSLFDAAMQQALGLAAQDSQLFSRYWCDGNAFEDFSRTLTEPASAFDLNAFMAVSSELAEKNWRLPDAPACEIVTVVGSGDPVVNAEHTRGIVTRWAPQTRVHVFDGCGHWLHLEAPEQFCDLVNAIIQ